MANITSREFIHRLVNWVEEHVDDHRIEDLSHIDIEIKTDRSAACCDINAIHFMHKHTKLNKEFKSEYYEEKALGQLVYFDSVLKPLLTSGKKIKAIEFRTHAEGVYWVVTVK